MTESKREVWVVENTGVQGPGHVALERAYLERTVLPSRGDRLVRYIPEPPEVEGWPTQDGFYWVRNAGDGARFVARVTDDACSGPGGFFSLREIGGDDLRFWGPLEPPRVKP